MTIGTLLFTMFCGRMVGQDDQGNRYYEETKLRRGFPRKRRWVIYKGQVEASRVPAEWHSWLHYTTPAPLTDAPRRPWQKPHEPNLTGTPLRFRPTRTTTTGDYESWTPGA